MCNWSIWKSTTTRQKYFCNLVVRTCFRCLIASVDHRGAQQSPSIRKTTTSNTKASTINTWTANEEKQKHEHGESWKGRNNVSKMLAHTRFERRKHTRARAHKMAQTSIAGRSGHKEADDDAGVPQSENMDSVKRVKSGPNMAAASSKNICTFSVLLVLFTVP